jgi:hypothetical protein
MLLNGAILASDIRTNALMQFDTAGRFVSRTAIGRFPVDIDVNSANSEISVLSTQFTPGSAAVERWKPGAATALSKLGPFSDFPNSQSPQEIYSVAVSADGRTAIANGSDEYRIRVFDASGKSKDVVRKIPRAVYTDAERAELKKREARAVGLRKAEGRGAAGAAPELPKEKTHLPWMALRFDPAGNLWVTTRRGNESTTIFDVFDKSLDYIGELRVAGTIREIEFGGGYAVTSGENEDGVPVVTLWRLK